MRVDLQSYHLFTHAGCMDGSGAAIIFRHAGGAPENIHWVKAGTVDECLAESKIVENPNVPLLLVDIAPDSIDGAMYLNRRGNFFVIDHHKSAERFADKPGFVISVGNTACGTELFREWLVKNGMTFLDSPPYQRFAALIDDHDRWVLKHPMSKEIPRFFAFAGQQQFVERFMNITDRFAHESERGYWTPFEVQVLGMIEQAQIRRFKGLLSRFIQRRTEFDGRQITVAYIISGEVNCSELLHAYLDKHPEADVACQINLDLNKVSLRSNDKVDITKFAAKFHGGGHRDSGGHGLPDDLSRRIIEAVHG